jgi:hypothetical protein
MNLNKVSVGPATYIGYGLTAIGLVATGIAAVEKELAGSGKWLAILTIVAGVLTNLGRQMQAPKA